MRSSDLISTSMAEAKERYAIVTGANKGIGLATVKMLASNGVKVVLTARDPNAGLQALAKLNDSGLPDTLVTFHQLDVTDPASIASLVDFVQLHFGRLDILVNNAGVGGVMINEPVGSSIEWSELTQTVELAEKCMKTNYHGAKETTEAFLPLLQSSDSATIVNVSSEAGSLKSISNEWAKGVLGDESENLREERIEEVVKEFMKDMREGCLESKGWPTFLSAYIVSKAALNTYTRLVARKYLKVCVNCVCPGFVKTDINRNTGILSVEEGAESVVRLALLPPGSPSGLFYVRQRLSIF